MRYLIVDEMLSDKMTVGEMSSLYYFPINGVTFFKKSHFGPNFKDLIFRISIEFVYAVSSLFILNQIELKFCD